MTSEDFVQSRSLSEFEEAKAEAHKIKEQFVDRQLRWYKKHLWMPFLMFRMAGIATIVLSVSLPAIAMKPTIPHKDSLVGIIGVVIAGLTSLSAFYRWERSWQSRTLTLFAIKAYSAKWELEVANAYLLMSGKDGVKHVYAATNDLIKNVSDACAAESEGFFRGLQFPQSQRPGTGNINKSGSALDGSA